LHGGVDDDALEVGTTIASVATAVSMVALRISSTPASPIAVRKRPTCDGSQGRRGS